MDQKPGNSRKTEQGIELERRIISLISTGKADPGLIYEVFRFQARECGIFRDYLKLLKINPEKVSELAKIPFLPVELFKENRVFSATEHEEIFYSSSTTGATPSSHYVKSLALYELSFVNAFKAFYGDPAGFTFLALLPGYLERSGSSLVYMVNHLMKISQKEMNGFFLEDHYKLKETLAKLESGNQKYLLIGVSHGLLDFAEKYDGIALKGGILMETGGMKGRKKEMVREDLHKRLIEKLGCANIHSEYGMTELLSQAYSDGKGIFKTPDWMKILIRDPSDPFTILPSGRTGGVNIIDLANLWSCSFIATQDLGKQTGENTFEISGRFDNSEVRGCNQMIS